MILLVKESTILTGEAHKKQVTIKSLKQSSRVKMHRTLLVIGPCLIMKLVVLDAHCLAKLQEEVKDKSLYGYARSYS